jgi:hypothetical protein
MIVIRRPGSVLPHRSATVWCDVITPTKLTSHNFVIGFCQPADDDGDRGKWLIPLRAAFSCEQFARRLLMFTICSIGRVTRRGLYGDHDPLAGDRP